MPCATGSFIFSSNKQKCVNAFYVWGILYLKGVGGSRNLQFWKPVAPFPCIFWRWNAVVWPGASMPPPRKLATCRSRHLVKSVLCGARGWSRICLAEVGSDEGSAVAFGPCCHWCVHKLWWRNPALSPLGQVCGLNFGYSSLCSLPAWPSWGVLWVA